MRKNVIYVILRTTSLTYHLANPIQQEKFNKLPSYKQEKIKRSHKNHTSFVCRLKELCSCLDLDVYFFDETRLEQIDVLKPSLVISCGGDGTFLSCAQKFTNSYFLGMNSDYQEHERDHGSYGALTSVNHQNIDYTMHSIAEGKYVTEEWQRLGASINGEKLNSYAVNDIFFGSKTSYLTCDISVQVGENEEDFCCSGYLVCTGMGSHAWFRAAGGDPFSNKLDAFGHRVLLPNNKRAFQFTSGVVSGDNQVIIRPNRDGYIMAFDSKEDLVSTLSGDEIKIFLARENPVKILKVHNSIKDRR